MITSTEQVSLFLDTILVSLDFEYSLQHPSRKNARNGYYVSQVGIACVKVLDFARSFSAPDSRLDMITTQLFNKGRWGEASKELRFGECTPVSEHNIEDVLIEFFRRIALQTSRGTPHNIILVGQEISHELRIMASPGMDISEIVPLAGIIDTASVSKLMLGERNSLFQLCKKLGILSEAYRHWFHNAGNDANLTMRAVLMLAAKGIDQSSVEPAGLQATQRLRAIAMEAIPPALTPPQAKTQDWEAALGALSLLTGFPD